MPANVFPSTFLVMNEVTTSHYILFPYLLVGDECCIESNTFLLIYTCMQSVQFIFLDLLECNVSYFRGFIPNNIYMKIVAIKLWGWQISDQYLCNQIFFCTRSVYVVSLCLCHFTDNYVLNFLYKCLLPMAPLCFLCESAKVWNHHTTCPV